jgi:Holliday junction DNA helicase RuvA
MIAYVEGILVERGTTAVVALAGGDVGLQIRVSSRTVEALPALGQRVRLWTHLIMRDDGWLLCGFTTRGERALFEMLISVSGIGPKVALNILSAASPEEIAGHLRRGDERSLARLPGIGRKSAARLVVELGQRVPAAFAALPEAEGGGGAADGSDPTLANAVAILAAMGLPPGRAEQALLAVRGSAPGRSDNLEGWIRAALQTL